MARRSLEDLDFGVNPLFQGGDADDNLHTNYTDTDALLHEFDRGSPAHYQGGNQRAGGTDELSPLSSIGSEPLFGTNKNDGDELLVDFDDFPEATPSNNDFLNDQLTTSHQPDKSKNHETPSIRSIDKHLQEVGNEAYSLVDEVTLLSSIVEEESSADDLRFRLKTCLEKMMVTASNVLSGLCSANEDFAQLALTTPSEPKASIRFRSNPLSDPWEEKRKVEMKTIDGEAELASLKWKIEALTKELADRQKIEAKDKQRVAEMEVTIAAINEEQAGTLNKLQSASDACQMLRSSLDRAADAAVSLAASSTPGQQQDNEEILASAIEASMRLVDRQAETLILPKAARDAKASDPHILKVSSLNSWGTRDQAAADLSSSLISKRGTGLSKVPESSPGSVSSLGGEKAGRSVAAETSWSLYQAGDDTSLPSLPGDVDDSDIEEYIAPDIGVDEPKVKPALRVTVTSPAGTTPPVMSPADNSANTSVDSAMDTSSFATIARLPQGPSRLQYVTSAVKRGREDVAAVTSHDDAAAVQGLQRELDALMAENVSLIAKLEETKAEAMQQAEYAEQEAGQVAELAASLDKAEEKIAELESSHSRLTRELESASVAAEVHRELSKRVWILEEECEKAKGSLRAASAGFTAKKKDMIERLKRRDQEISEAEARADKAERELAEASEALTTWKVRGQEAEAVLSRATERAKSITYSVLPDSNSHPIKGSSVSRIPSFTISSVIRSLPQDSPPIPHSTAVTPSPPELNALQARAVELEGQLRQREIEVEELSNELEGLLTETVNWHNTLECVEATTAALKSKFEALD